MNDSPGVTLQDTYASRANLIVFPLNEPLSVEEMREILTNVINERLAHRQEVEHKVYIGGMDVLDGIKRPVLAIHDVTLPRVDAAAKDQSDAIVRALVTKFDATVTGTVTEAWVATCNKLQRTGLPYDMSQWPKWAVKKYRSERVMVSIETKVAQELYSYELLRDKLKPRLGPKRREFIDRKEPSRYLNLLYKGGLGSEHGAN